MLHHTTAPERLDQDSLVDQFTAAVAVFAERPAIEFLGRVWSYAALGDLVERAARGLQDLGVEKGTRVGLCLPNTPYSVVFYHAVLRAGGIVVNINPLYVEREIAQQVADSGAEIIVVIDLAAIHDKVVSVCPSIVRHVIVCPLAGALKPAQALAFRVLKRKLRARVPADGRHVRWADVIANRAPPAPVPIEPARDLAVLQYTGGTTGSPKGAMLTHRNVRVNAQQVRAHMPSLRPGMERMLGVLPLFHVFAMTTVMNLAVEIGAAMILLPRYDLKQVLRTIVRARPTIFPAVPTIYGAINGAAADGGVDLTSIRLCISGGAPLPQEVRERFETLTGCKLVEGYGLTEASPVVACNPPDGRVKPGSIGLPMRDTLIEIRDPADPSRIMPTGDRGELCVRGPQVMAGYWQRDADTRAAFYDGALRTGDIGYVDDEGYFFLVDRIKDLILCSGYNVYPRVIEEALYQHPAVAEAVVIGVADSYRGQAPKAFVTLRPGMPVSEAELIGFLGGYISKIEMPKAIVFRETLPRTLVGKLSKKELIAEEQAGT